MLKKTKEAIKNYKSTNLKSGKFKDGELDIYDTHMTDAEIILKYQEILPVLQDENSSTVNARDLHNQLGVGKDFSTWIKEKIENYGFEDKIDYSIETPKTGNQKGKGGDRRSIEYSLTLSTAKELAMVQNNDAGRIARKYFIAIENAYKNRDDWNYDRADTLIGSKELKKAIIINNKKLLVEKPSWAKGGVHQAEFCMFNNVIIGMCATEYRKLMGLKKSDSIRNTFTEQQLEYVAELEKYDADLIMVQGIFNYDKRQEILTKKYTLMA